MDTKQLWETVLGELELQLSKANFTTWFKNTAISSYENNNVIISVPNTFTQAWLEKKYRPQILKILKEHTNNEIKEIIYKVENIKKEKIVPCEIPNKKEEIEIKEREQILLNNTQRVPAYDEFGLNTKYNFDTFIVGKSNELAHAACQAVINKPGLVYNPLFIYGGVGLGKTHLLQSIGNAIKERVSNTKILYASFEKFTNDYINSVKTGREKDFHDKYRSVDLLLLDDIQFISGKERTQEAFFHTFNTLHQANKQIIITSDKPPKAISGIEKRLLSRFEWGMIADIQNPDLETRMAILEEKCEERNFILKKEIIQYIAANIQSNIRELEGALNRIIVQHQLQKTEPTLITTKAILTSIIAMYPKKSLTPKQIVQTICQFYDISQEDIVGSCRKRELVVPRQIIMYLLRQELQYSYPSIGKELGGRDHTTAMHAFQKIKTELENNEKLRQDVNYISQRLYNN